MEHQTSDRDKLEKSIQWVMLDLRRKAIDHEKAAKMYFVLLVGTTIVGLLAFIFAYKFTSNTEIENQIENSKQFFVNTIKSREKKIDSIQFRNMSYIFISDAYKSKIEDLIKYTDFKTSNYPEVIKDWKSNSYDSLKVIIANHSRLIDEPKSSIEYLKVKYNEQSRKKYIDSLANIYFGNVKSGIIDGLKTSNYELYNLINTIATRFGSIVILLFLVQILIRVFRYNSRLANFYRSRSYALEIYLMDPSNLKIETLIASLSPDQLDMGISKNPSDQVLELVKLYNSKK